MSPRTASRLFDVVDESQIVDRRFFVAFLFDFIVAESDRFTVARFRLAVARVRF